MGLGLEELTRPISIPSNNNNNNNNNFYQFVITSVGWFLGFF
jgi:hypothetical protein